MGVHNSAYKVRETKIWWQVLHIYKLVASINNTNRHDIKTVKQLWRLGTNERSMDTARVYPPSGGGDKWVGHGHVYPPSLGTGLKSICGQIFWKGLNFCQKMECLVVHYTTLICTVLITGSTAKQVNVKYLTELYLAVFHTTVIRGLEGHDNS